MTSRRNGIERNEFQGNFTVATRAELEAILVAHRERRLGKDRMRVFAAMLEKRALHVRSRVDMHRIVNAKRSTAKLLSRGRIERLEKELGDLLACAPKGGKKVAVSRRMARHIATGQAAPSEAIVLIYYCMRRLKQRQRRELLLEGERYARFRYVDLAVLSGCGRSTLCRAVERLRRRGYLQALEVRQASENANGCLFVDGSLVTLTSHAGRRWRSRRKATTPAPVSDNAPDALSTTLENRDPKTRILNRRGFPFALVEVGGALVATVANPRPANPARADAVGSPPVRSTCPEFLRIQERARQMRESWAEPVA